MYGILSETNYILFELAEQSLSLDSLNKNENKNKTNSQI